MRGDLMVVILSLLDYFKYFGRANLGRNSSNLRITVCTPSLAGPLFEAQIV